MDPNTALRLADFRAAQGPSMERCLGCDMLGYQVYARRVPVLPALPHVPQRVAPAGPRVPAFSVF